jgi:hypothetical protein
MSVRHPRLRRFALLTPLCGGQRADCEEKQVTRGTEAKPVALGEEPERKTDQRPPMAETVCLPNLSMKVVRIIAILKSPIIIFYMKIFKYIDLLEFIDIVQAE